MKRERPTFINSGGKKRKKQIDAVFKPENCYNDK